MKPLLLTMVWLLNAAVWGAPVTVSHGYFDITFYNAGDTNQFATGQQDWTAAQIADVTASIDAWANRIANVPGRPIRMDVFWEEMDPLGAGVLGGSSSYLYSDGTTQWNFGEYVWKEGADPGNTDYGFDTIIRYDITAGGMGWNFGSNAPTGEQYDFRSVLTHELGHSLGFWSTYGFGFDDWGWYIDTYGGLSDWDRHLVDEAGNKPLNGARGTPGNFNQSGNPVYWDGAAATAEYGDLVPIHAPANLRRNSSLTHLDETLLGDFLMSPVLLEGQTMRTVSDLEWAMMTDMGWTIVPEPASLLLLAMGGCILAKRRNSSL